MNVLATKFTDDDGPTWPDLAGKLDKIIHLGEGSTIGIGVLKDGVSNVVGKQRPSVAIRIDLPDGRVVMAETTARLFCTAAKMIEARYPDLFEEG